MTGLAIWSILLAPLEVLAVLLDAEDSFLSLSSAAAS
jgi:hypothetical protein